jgi:hypothetical protein
MPYQIAADHDSAGSLVTLTTITPSSDLVFFEPLAFNGFTPGRQVILGDGSIKEVGYAATVWGFGVLTDGQYQYLYDTYASLNDGKVTIQTRGRDGDFANFNARIILPPRASLQYRPDDRRVYTDVSVRFIRMVAL